MPLDHGSIIISHAAKAQVQNLCWVGFFNDGETRKKVLFDTELLFLVRSVMNTKNLTSNYGQSSFYMV
jgi:hypothetical protein